MSSIHNSYSGKIAGQVEKKGTSVSCVPNGKRESYDTKSKLMVIKYADKMKSCNPAKKFYVADANVQRWRQQKQKHKLHPKIFQWPQTWTLELEILKCVCVCVCL